MKLLEDRILKDGIIGEGNVLKVNSFVNHQIDVPFICELGKEFKRLYEGEKITKILTIEASGIGIACVTAQYFGVPVVFAKKAKSKNLDGEMLVGSVESFTYGKTYEILVSKKFISPDDRILLIDDFLANGKALIGLSQIVMAAGATIAGAGIDGVSVEPMREDNPLLQAKNGIITPHTAWATIEARRRLIDIVAGNLDAFLKGEPVNIVNQPR